MNSEIHLIWVASSVVGNSGSRLGLSPGKGVGTGGRCGRGLLRANFFLAVVFFLLVFALVFSGRDLFAGAALFAVFLAISRPSLSGP